ALARGERGAGAESAGVVARADQADAGDVDPGPGGSAFRVDRGAGVDPGVRVLVGAADPEQHLVGWLSPRAGATERKRKAGLGFDAWRLRDVERCRARAVDEARVEQADRERNRCARRRAVGQLGIEVRIDIAEPDAPEGRPAGPDAAAGRPDPEQGRVVEDVLALVETELTAGQHLPPTAADGEVHLAHVDLGTEDIVHARAVDLGGDAEVDADG